MTRQKKDPSQKQSIRVQVLLTSAEFELLTSQAAGKSLSSYIRSLLLQRLQEPFVGPIDPQDPAEPETGPAASCTPAGQPQPSNCGICGQTFPSKAARKRHRQEAHPV